MATAKVRTKSSKKAAGKKLAKRPSVRAKSNGSKAAVAATPGSKDRLGAITHTELASANPTATRKWCERVLGWKFMEPVPTPTGPYHMWRFALGTGGGIRANNPPEVPGSIPYCEVASIKSTYAAALKAGATEMVPPMALPGGMGWVAVVAAPGGVAFGFWAMK